MVEGDSDSDAVMDAETTGDTESDSETDSFSESVWEFFVSELLILNVIDFDTVSSAEIEWDGDIESVDV